MRLLRVVAISLMASFAPCICHFASAADATPVSTTNGLTKNSEKQVVTVSVQQAKRLHDLGATFIDIRSLDEWRIGHIDNALHLDFYEDLNSLRENPEISKNTPLVFYCESSECMQAAYASAVSIFWGFDNVFYFQDGYFAWLLKDYPIHSLVSKLH